MLHLGLFIVSLLSAAEPAERMTIAVAPFTTTATSEYEWIGPAVAQALSTRVLGHPKLNGTTLRQVEAALRDDNIEPASVSDPENAIRLGHQLGADLVVVGTYSAQWPDIQFLVKVIDLASGKAKVTQTVGGDLETLVDIEAQLAKILADAIAPQKLDVRPGAFGTKVLWAWREDALAHQTLAWQSLAPASADPSAPAGLPLTAVQQARSHAQHAVALDPGYGDAWAVLAFANALLDDRAQCVAAFAKAKAASKDFNPFAVLAGAFADVHQGRAEDALAKYADALTRYPGFLHARGYLGELYNKLGRHKEALAVFEAYLQLAPKQPWTLAQRGYTKSKLGDHIGAIADTIKAVDMLPRSPSLLVQLASRYIDANKLIGAEDTLMHALEMHPKEARIYTRLGYVYLLQGKDDLAIAISEKALLQAEFATRMRDRAYAHLNLARAYGHGGQIDKAMESLTLAHSEDATVPFSEIADDPKLEQLRADPRYKKLGMP